MILRDSRATLFIAAAFESGLLERGNDEGIYLNLYPFVVSRYMDIASALC